ncbi:hypothetical protein BDR04DRAFT_1156286 [Suillus decipiens]|nr:hypothetical protein BDR04DRAFT_1156286 [Suillus decipiens]
MHSHAIPPGEDVTMMQSQMTLDGKLICKPPAFTKEGLLEYIMELIVTEDKATLLCKICHAIDHDEDTDIASLTEQLAALEHDPEAIVEDGFDVSDAVGKALALIEQICKSLQAQAFFKKSCEEEGVAVHEILTWEPATAQQLFSLVAYPTAWQTIPTLECLASVWGMIAGNPEYAIIVDAITKGLKNVEKYYQKASDLDVYFICLVLDPNYKLAYVKQ